MKAAVFHKIGHISVDNVTDPTIEQQADTKLNFLAKSLMNYLEIV